MSDSLGLQSFHSADPSNAELSSGPDRPGAPDDYDPHCYGDLTSAMGREILKNIFVYPDRDGDFTAERFEAPAAELFLKTIGGSLVTSDGASDASLLEAGRTLLQQILPAAQVEPDHVTFVNSRADLLLHRIFPGAGPWGPVREKVTARAQADGAYRQRLIDGKDDPKELLNLVNEAFANTGVVFTKAWNVRVALDYDPAAEPGHDNVFHLVVPPVHGYGPLTGVIETFGWC